jgi:cytochrome bd-type quinol oxidase subunit 2
MVHNYTTPLARWARILEIFIPGYMFGKSWGIADEKTADLFRAEFPVFLINAAEFLKGILQTGNENLERLVATCAGAIVGFLIIVVLAIAIHFVLRDRKYIDSLRFTSVTLIPIAVMNGTLSHVMKTLLEGVDMQTTEALTQSALRAPWNYFYMNLAFYMIALWMLGRRTGVKRNRRWALIGVGLAFMATYLACGLMIMPGEWSELLPKLQQSLAH